MLQNGLQRALKIDVSTTFPKSFAEIVQKFSEKIAPSLKSSSLAAYLVHASLLKFCDP